MFLAIRIGESLMQIMLPKESPFKISMLKQYAWWIGSTDKITVRDGIFISRQVAFSARLRCVNITPLLFPVVPDVNIIVHSASGFAHSSKPFSLSERSRCRERTSPSASSFCMEMILVRFGQASFAMAATSARNSSYTRAVTSARLISSQISCGGSATSSGTATLPQFTVPR